MSNNILKPNDLTLHSVTIGTNATVNTHIDPNTKITVATKQKYKEDYGPCIMIGKPAVNINKPEIRQPHLLEILHKISHGAEGLYIKFFNCRDFRTNIVEYTTKEYSKNQLIVFNRNLRELIQFELVTKLKTINKLKPVKKQTYMLNPIHLKCTKYNKAVANWNFLVYGIVPL